MMINDEVDEVIEGLINHSKTDIKIIWNRLKVVDFSFIMFIYYIINVTKQIQIVVDQI